MEYIQKDILTAFREGEFNVLLHQTNCVTKERVSGIAKSIFEEYPIALQQHLNQCEFASYSMWSNIDRKAIVNCNSQYYQGGCSNLIFDHPNGYKMPDCFENRLLALSEILDSVKYNALNDSDIIGIPLIASDRGADKDRKVNMTTLEYFKKYIAPTVEMYFPDAKVYYL